MFTSFAKQKLTGFAKQKKIALLLLVMGAHSHAESCDSVTSLLQTRANLSVLTTEVMFSKAQQKAKLLAEDSSKFVNESVTLSGSGASLMESARTNSTLFEPYFFHPWNKWTECKGPDTRTSRAWDTTAQIEEKTFYQTMAEECKKKKQWLCATRAHCDEPSHPSCRSICMYGGTRSGWSPMDHKNCYTNLMHQEAYGDNIKRCNENCLSDSQKYALSWRYKCVEDNDSDRINNLLKLGFPVKCDKLDGNGLTSFCLRNFVGNRRRRYKCFQDSPEKGFNCVSQGFVMR